MVKALNFYSALLTSGHSKCFPILPNINSFIHTFTHRNICQQHAWRRVRVRVSENLHSHTFRSMESGDPSLSLWTQVTPLRENTHPGRTHTQGEHTPRENTHPERTHLQGEHTPMENTYPRRTYTHGEHTPRKNTHPGRTHTHPP